MFRIVSANNKGLWRETIKEVLEDFIQVTNSGCEEAVVVDLFGKCNILSYNKKDGLSGHECLSGPIYDAALKLGLNEKYNIIQMTGIIDKYIEVVLIGG
jgi:hypothetical protein